MNETSIDKIDIRHESVREISLSIDKELKKTNAQMDSL